MAKPTSPPRIPKGSKEGGRFMPKWAAELRESLAKVQRLALEHGTDVDCLTDKVSALDRRTEAMCKAMASTFDGTDKGPHLVGPRSLQSQINDLRERLGTSTPLIIWNIAVLIAIAYLYCKAYVPGTP